VEPTQSNPQQLDRDRQEQSGQERFRDLSPDVKRSIRGGIFSLLVDSYDIYLPALVLPAAMAYFEPATLSPSIRVTLITITFAVTLLARPIGGPLFGNLSDTIGRRRTTLITTAGFTVVTLLIGLLPGYATWGYGSIGALIFLRLIGGVFLGGGYAGPVPLAMERSPAHLRGLIGGLIAAGAPLAIIFINIVELFGLHNMQRAAFIQWGWRIPFFFGGLLGVAYFIYYSRVPELSTGARPQRGAKPKQPLMQLLSRGNLGGLLQAFLLMTGMWFAAQIVLSFLPSLLIGVLHQPATDVSTLEVVVNVLAVGGMVAYAVISQRIGRRRTLIASGLSVAIGATASFILMVHFAEARSSFIVVAVFGSIAFLLANAPLGCIVVYLNERFGTGVRASGYSTAYTVALILPGLYSFWLLALRGLVPFQYTGAILIALGGLLFALGSYLGPETRSTTLVSETTGGDSVGEGGLEVEPVAG
jgi:MFS family permease